MKPVLRNVLLALGLLPMSVFADSAEERYEGQANVTGMYGSQDSSYGEVDLWQPLWQAWDRVVSCLAMFVQAKAIVHRGKAMWEVVIAGLR